MAENRLLRELCGDDEKMYGALKTLGLFSEPTRITEKLEHFVDKAKEVEKGFQTPVAEARYLYRIIMRLALYYGRHDVLEEYAQKENRFLTDKSYEPIIKEAEKAIDIVQKYYTKK